MTATDEQREAGLKIADIVLGLKPIDAMAVLVKSAYIILRTITVPDESGNKTERMRRIWADIFDATMRDVEGGDSHE